MMVVAEAPTEEMMMVVVESAVEEMVMVMVAVELGHFHLRIVLLPKHGV